ncbi:DNA-binding protein YbiB [Uliginosibacterium sp. 31-16]|uniref:DNA-binding protein YbiB n=1 Tax=Uliginosibacterium sp. 31-16 TaxID=3068315 RepID=UPI00273F9F30|nr:DNA-binding protein YbiB [Uliginosibacterium sp. 31-16]MDP5240117.1 DNA-binding protein YbiB [Uliginosibacterium sp. 31-16]
MNYASIIKEIGRGAKGARSMPREQAQELFGLILDGKVPDMELGAILMALRIKGETPDELLGFLAALDERTRQVSVPAGPRCVLLPTYNGARKQPNLMPLVALLLAREGVPVLVQGRHDFESRVSPFDLLAALGIDTERSLPDAAAALADRHIACLRLDMLARGLDWLLGLRLTLGVRNSGHTLAKLLDPCRGRSVRVVAVTHPPYLESMQTLLEAKQATALLMRGTEGEAYAAPRRRPRLLGFTQGIAEEIFAAAEFGGEEIEGESCSVAENAALIRRMLADETPVPQPILDQVAALKALACN